MKKITSVLMFSALTPLLIACASTDPAAAGEKGSAARADTSTQITDAATSPLSDLNLVRADIPAVLAAARRDPYRIPVVQSCEALAVDIRALDDVLGADLDIPPTPGNPGLIERGTGAAGNAAIGALRGAAEGVVPFRSWVRKLSGAERYSRDVAASIAAGTVRRAYLKGLGLARGCAAPAAPRRAEP